MSILHRIAAFLIPSIDEFHIDDRRFNPEEDTHLQWMEGQRLDSERRVQQQREAQQSNKRLNVVEERYLGGRQS